MPKIGRLLATFVGILTLAAGLGACSSEGDAPELVVYSGRNENLIRPLLDRFEKAHPDIKLKVRYGDTPDTLATIMEEGKDRTRADVFISQDAGALAELADQGFLADLPEATLELVDDDFRDPAGRWTALTGRARVIAHSTERVPAAAVPDDVLELVEPKWKGRVGFAPSNASFIAFVSALREQLGDDQAQRWLEGLAANDAKRYDNNLLTLEAIASGEIDLGLVNHYYLHAMQAEKPDVRIANHFPGQAGSGSGTFVNISGAGVLANSDQQEAAETFVSFLLSTEGQSYFRDETFEYPMRKGVEPSPGLPSLSTLRTIEVPLSDLGGALEATVAMIKEAGLS